MLTMTPPAVKNARLQDTQADLAPANPSRLKLAYLTTEYPKVSHTFIRREIAELEKQGHEIVRLSIRPPSAPLVDEADLLEEQKTIVGLRQSKLRLLASAARLAMTRPAKFFSAARLAMRFHGRSDRGAVRHVAYLSEAAFLSGVLQAQGINHVHVHFGTNAATVALLMKKLAGISYSMTVHGPGEFDAPIGLSLAEKVAESAFTVAISHYGKSQLQRWVAPEHWGRIHVVRCTVNQDFLAPPTPIDPQSQRLLCIGRLTPQKGQLLLIDAFAEHVKSSGAGHLVFAGDGDLRGAIEQRIRQHNLEHRVTITGWLSEKQVRQEILAARALVQPSSAEGLPVVIMEALAMGRPALSTFTAGIPELVKPGENGWLVPSGDVTALTAALHHVMTTPVDQLQLMGMNGHQAAQRQHHPVSEAKKLVEYLAKLSIGHELR